MCQQDPTRGSSVQGGAHSGCECVVEWFVGTGPVDVHRTEPDAHRKKCWQTCSLAERNQIVVTDVADGQAARAQREHVWGRAKHEPVLIFLVEVAHRG